MDPKENAAATMLNALSLKAPYGTFIIADKAVKLWMLLRHTQNRLYRLAGLRESYLAVDSLACCKLPFLICSCGGRKINFRYRMYPSPLTATSTCYSWEDLSIVHWHRRSYPMLQEQKMDTLIDAICCASSLSECPDSLKKAIIATNSLHSERNKDSYNFSITSIW